MGGMLHKCFQGASTDLLERRHCSLINRPETPLPNLNSTNIFLWSVWGQTTKFKDRQYFWLYSRGKMKKVKSQQSLPCWKLNPPGLSHQHPTTEL